VIIGRCGIVPFGAANRARIRSPAAVGGAGAGIAFGEAGTRVVRGLAQEQQRAVARTEEVGVAGELDDSLAFESDQGRIPFVHADFEGAGTGHAGHPALAPDFEQGLLREDVVGTAIEQERQPVAGRGEPES